MSNISSTSSNATLVNRQSRLVQPTAPTSNGSSRLTYVSSISRINTPSSTFLPNGHQQASSSSRNSTMQHYAPLVGGGRQYNQQVNAPPSVVYGNANTSGLPAPQRQPTIRSASGQYSPVADGGPAKAATAAAAAPPPSTVGSALRRRQPSPVVPLKISSSSRLPPPSTTTSSNLLNSSQVSVGPNNQPTSSFCIRRSQSQRPSVSQASLYRTQTSFAAQMRATSTRSKSQMRQESMEQDDEDDEDSAKCVESLLPLKSASYIGRIVTTKKPVTNNMSASCDKTTREKESIQMAEPQSEPIVSASTNKSSIKTTSKPSQLVKPLATVNSSNIQNGQRRSSIGRSTSKTNIATTDHQKETCNKFGSTFGSGLVQPKPIISSNKAPVSKRTSSFVQAPTKSTKLPSMISVGNNEGSPKPSSGARPSDLATRRLSLQQPGYDLQTKLRRGPLRVERSHGSEDDSGSESSNGADEEEDQGADDGDEEDGYEEEFMNQDEDEEEEEEDDATTATTMTQMSDSNLINQEFNNMMQMLSSSAILGDSNLNDDSLNSASSTSYENDSKEKSRKVVSSEKKLAATNNKSSSQSPSVQLPKVKNKVIKSQSLSFNNRFVQSNVSNKIDQYNDKQENANQTHQMASSSSILLTNESKPNSVNSGSRSSNGENGVKLSQPSRPRSRIIFDPTSSQFHVSCAPEDDDTIEQYHDDTNYSQNNTNRNNILAQAASTRQPREHYRGEEQIIDESSMKLLDTHNQIMTLKYLPNAPACSSSEMAGVGGPPSLDSGHMDEENDTIRRLKDCRGSLESLMIIGPRDSSAEVVQQQEDTIITPYGSLPASSQLVDQSSAHRKSPVGAALRSIFGLQPSPARETITAPTAGCSTSKNKVATIVRHASLRTDPRTYEDFELGVTDSRKISNLKRSETNSVLRDAIVRQPPSINLGTDLLHRASKKLSASSSSLTSKFKFMSATNNGSSPLATVANMTLSHHDSSNETKQIARTVE